MKKSRTANYDADARPIPPLTAFATSKVPQFVDHVHGARLARAFASEQVRRPPGFGPLKL